MPASHMLPFFHPGVKFTHKRSKWQKGLQPWCSGISQQLWNRQAEYFYSQKDNLISYLSCFYWTRAESNHNGYFQIRFSFFSLNGSRIGLSRLILCLCSGPAPFPHTYIPKGLVWPDDSWLLCVPFTGLCPLHWDKSFSASSSQTVTSLITLLSISSSSSSSFSTSLFNMNPLKIIITYFNSTSNSHLMAPPKELFSLRGQNIIYIIFKIMYVHVSLWWYMLVSMKAGRRHQIPWPGVTWGCEPPERHS